MPDKNNDDSRERAFDTSSESGPADDEEFQEVEDEESEAGAESVEVDTGQLQKSFDELNDRYLRLYAEFENYKKITSKNREDLLKYSNENIMSGLLTVVDNLELALQHSTGDSEPSSLAEGVEMTLKELMSVLEKHGLSYISTLDQPFDPNIHHAMSQIETDEVDENIVVKEFRKGYMCNDRVLRAPLVGVSKKPLDKNETIDEEEEE